MTPHPSATILQIHSAGTPGVLDARTATIANIGDQDWYVSRTYGTFHIPACAKSQPYSLLIVTQRGDALDLGDGRKFPFTISAREIAADLVQDLEPHGVFVCEGARPAEAELARAASGREEFYKQLVFEGDQIWARSHNYREISDLQRRAVLALGLEREWAYVPQKMLDCPVCGEKIKPGVALCRHCGAVLDSSKAGRYRIYDRTGPANPQGAAPVPAQSEAPARHSPPPASARRDAEMKSRT